MTVKELGVGLVYWAELEPLVRGGNPAISVLELEPQTLWEKVRDASGWRYRTNEALLERVAALPQAKLLHGVGHPLGGTARDPLDSVPALRHAVERLDPAWVSEHLSFNRVRLGEYVEDAGFLLPPPQTPAAVWVAAHNIANYRRVTRRPVAFETGVNYLPVHEGDIPDGDFFAAVADVANSGIVLDLHNLWCNEKNGRTPVAEVLARLPLERVWEIHLAGGMEASGYWLDAHSGAVPGEVMDIAARLIPDLPNLGALIFEVLPQHLPRIGLDGVQAQLEALHGLWKTRPPGIVRAVAAPRPMDCDAMPTDADIVEVARWEAALVAAIRGQPGAASPCRAPGHDAGCALLRELVLDFRRASLTRALRYTMTSLLAGLGAEGTRALLDAYFQGHSPDPFAAVEAERFARFLRPRLCELPRIAYLDEILSFEYALVRATLHGAASEVAWSADPTLLFDSLDAGRLPGDLPPCSSTMRICAGG